MGSAVRKALKRDLSPAQHARLLEEGSPDVARILRERFVATQWYPVAGIEELISRPAQMLGRDPLDYARSLGGSVVSEAAGTVGRTVMSLFATPQRVAKHFDSIWQQAYDSGHVEGAYDEARGVLVVERSDWAGHGPLLCMTLLGTILAISDGMNGHRVAAATRTACISEGAPRCRFELRYAPK
ncbi:hypothetical protein DB32_004288 [Sandaracinus amylolyticus]|uniref:4-vinyl reductase 4VR domain-containing protein n=2 Tax=Sandaracinus amylolyticus TaxID=927083 RepID=A0A0F6SFL2_9BACT|nr:hypothetical protein DB32_004288 [Sandaracinus amylolyticus]